MTHIAHYLEAIKIEQVAEQLTLEGYHVLFNQATPDTSLHYDIVATKAGKRIAIGVKARSQLRDVAHSIRDLREYATQQGFDEFRLVVVNPPHERTIEIDNFESILYGYIVNNSFTDIDDLPGRASIEDVSGIDIDSIDIKVDGMHVRGTGVISVSLEHGGGDANDGVSVDYDFPFTFFVILTHDMRIPESVIDIDTSSFFE